LTRAHDPYAALRFSGFRLFIIVIWSLTMATQIQAVVVQWQIYELTRDPLWLGLIGLAEAVPFILFAIYAGHVADRHNRKLIGILSFAVLLLCTAALLLFTLQPERFLSKGVLPIFLVIIASGVARSFQRPATTAFSAQLIPRELYPNGVTWRTSMWQVAAVAGPAIGGLLYGFGGAKAAYSVDLALMVIAIAALAPIVALHEPDRSESANSDRSLLAGVRFVMGEKILLGAMTLDLFSVLFGGAVALLPIFAADILHVGPQGLGLLRAAPAVGSVIMGIALAHRPPFRRAGRTLLISVALFGLTMIAFALSRSFVVSMLLLIGSGMADSVSVVVRSTLLQVRTPGNMLGRVSAVNQIFIGSSNEIGAFESGVAARFLGTVPSVVFGGVMTMLVVGATALALPQLRSLKKIEES
jgi:MFS family permease